MHSHSTRNTKRLTTIVDAWTNLRPTKSFAGMTLAEFELAMAPSIEARHQLRDALALVAKAIVDRDNADRQTMPTLRRVVAAVVADETEGDDSALYAAMGYVRKSDRRSGLTRRTAAPSGDASTAEAA